MAPAQSLATSVPSFDARSAPRSERRRSEPAAGRFGRRSLAALISIVLAAVGTLAGADAAAAATEFSLVFSAASDRTAPMPLEGATVEETLYAFITSEVDVETVAFYLDDPTRSGTPENTETNAPFDFNGGSVTNGFGYDTETLSNGTHTITADITTAAGTTTVQSTFTVDNPVLPGPGEFDLLVSETSDRAAPMRLDGSVVGGALYAFTSPDTLVQSVDFHVDDPDMSDAPHTVENTAPFDLGGGTLSNSNGLNTTTLDEGIHLLTAAITTSDATTTVVHAEFTVDNNGVLPVADDFDIVVSDRADRAGAVMLEGATVDGDAFVFTTPTDDVVSVTFYVDDPTLSGPPRHTDTAAPFDLVGGDAANATAFDTSTLTNDQHNVTARIVTNEGAVTIEADFTALNSDSDLVPLTPARLADSRPGNPTADGDDEAFGRMAAGGVKEIQITGRGGVPTNATAALLNVTAVRPDAEGYFTVYPCDGPRPLTSNVNYFAGGIEPNAVLAKLTTTGSICIYTLAASHLVVDVNGYTT